MSLVLDKLDEEKFNKNIIVWLDADDFFKGCQTNFRDVIIDTVIDIISEITERDGWNLQYFDEDEKEELFISFMENSEVTVRLNREINEMDYEYKEITVKFNLSEDEKKKIAEIYLSKIFNNSYYFEECIIKNFDDIIAKIFSDKVYQLLTASEIKTKFKDKLGKIINDN